MPSVRGIHFFYSVTFLDPATARWWTRDFWALANATNFLAMMRNKGRTAWISAYQLKESTQ